MLGIHCVVWYACLTGCAATCRMHVCPRFERYSKLPEGLFWRNEVDESMCHSFEDRSHMQKSPKGFFPIPNFYCCEYSLISLNKRNIRYTTWRLQRSQPLFFFLLSFFHPKSATISHYTSHHQFPPPPLLFFHPHPHPSHSRSSSRACRPISRSLRCGAIRCGVACCGTTCCRTTCCRATCC